MKIENYEEPMRTSSNQMFQKNPFSPVSTRIYNLKNKPKLHQSMSISKSRSKYYPDSRIDRYNNNKEHPAKKILNVFKRSQEIKLQNSIQQRLSKNDKSSDKFNQLLLPTTKKQTKKSSFDLLKSVYFQFINNEEFKGTNDVARYNKNKNRGNSSIKNQNQFINYPSLSFEKPVSARKIESSSKNINPSFFLSTEQDTRFSTLTPNLSNITKIRYKTRANSLRPTSRTITRPEKSIKLKLNKSLNKTKFQLNLLNLEPWETIQYQF